MRASASPLKLGSVSGNHSILGNQMSSRASKVGFGLLVVATLLFGGGCTKKNKDLEVTLPAGKGKLTLPLKETLRVRIASEPPSLDWHKATDTTSALVTSNLMDGLVGYDFSKGEPNIVPALASKWETQDNKTWIFTLRDGVKWSDGEFFTAQHVLDGFQRLVNPATASEYGYFLYPIKNARAYAEGKIKDFSQVGVSIPNPNQVKIELEKPMAFFPFLLTHHSTFPIRLDVVQKHGDKWTEPENIVTIGPFKMIVWEHDKQLVLERNPNYYGTPASLKHVVILMIQEATTAVNLFDSGKIDAMNDLPPQQLRQLKGRKEFKAIGSLVIQYYGFNVLKKPMDNVKVRQAIAHAIDRQEIVSILDGGQIPMTSFVPAGMFGYEASRGLPFNVERSKQLLKEAGYTDVSKFPKIDFRMNTAESHQLVAENVQAQLKRNLGINMEIKNEEWKVYLSTLTADAPPMFRFGWSGDYPDPDNFLNLMTSYSENNRCHWKNKKFDDLIEQAATESDREKRRELYAQAQKIMVEEEAPLVPLYSSVNQHLVSERVENYPVNILGYYKYNEVRLK